MKRLKVKIILLLIVLSILSCSTKMQMCTTRCNKSDRTDTEVEVCIKKCMGVTDGNTN